ncbi:methylenetetrahydrofolate--tRNA-(uracil(54)-C(5))-methyltransferase (FADH(2)-oxidizing) TrmFO [Pasteuria penetrans]|uniref:methylenetetrahydrofolate--tRNA-(uracil(54)- C(5))-methyltransferase (FADH(2)-oxidizing) TrmFO n=1 Tax=Pasteuria penetrans TaxID=86005 RepID=UPI0011EBAA11|nr:methylenetetrahydrofolate--tRNA-(uracil(54)-C(5))-methyltransferase (FADH(2)-oxidizing) TrmFO [Pasteuria penetrans]
MSVSIVTVVGAGLAGSEASYQLARCGVKVRLYEMRPHKQTPAHHTDRFAELVCSNSLRSNALQNAVGILKEEMRRLDSLILRAADRASVPAGSALAVDRDQFTGCVTETLCSHPLIEVKRQELTSLPEEGLVVVATGPLTSDSLAEQVRRLTGEDYLSFYDAAAPIVTQESIDGDQSFMASRYGRGKADYVNCPMSEGEFAAFQEALLMAEVVEPKKFENFKGTTKGTTYFEGCLPVEILAGRGPKTLLFGPLKPVGLVDPRTGKQPFAVVQLRQDNQAATLFNLVGFQTRLKWGEQRRVFRMVPALAGAEFVRYGVVHRNTFLCSPALLEPTYQLRVRPTLFFAGQLTGVEGYVESAASGLLAGIQAARMAQGRAPFVPPSTTVIGSLAHYISNADKEHFQPMNANFGLLPPLPRSISNKRERIVAFSERALQDIGTLQEQVCFP